MFGEEGPGQHGHHTELGQRQCPVATGGDVNAE